MATVVITGNAGEWPLSPKLKEKLKTPLDTISIAELVREFKHYRNTNTSGIVPSFLRMVPQDAILDLSTADGDAASFFPPAEKVVIPPLLKPPIYIYIYITYR